MIENFTTIILLAVLIGVVILMGREFEVRYKRYADYTSDDKPSTFQEQARAGSFWLLDFASEVVFPGTRKSAIRYKRDKVFDDVAGAARQPPPYNAAANNRSAGTGQTQNDQQFDDDGMQADQVVRGEDAEKDKLTKNDDENGGDGHHDDDDDDKDAEENGTAKNDG